MSLKSSVNSGVLSWGVRSCQELSNSGAAVSYTHLDVYKRQVILQYVLETLLIAVVAFPLAYLSSKQVAGTLGTLFGKAAENVIVTPEHFMLVAIVGDVYKRQHRGRCPGAGGL